MGEEFVLMYKNVNKIFNRKLIQISIVYIEKNILEINYVEIYL